MKEWPVVTIVICTYKRPKIIRETLSSIFTGLIYPPSRLRWHIADDGTGGSYVEDIAKYIHNNAQGALLPEVTIRATITDRRGWGANVNKALKAVTTDYVYFTEDDYAMLRPLDLRPSVVAMETVPVIGMMRYGIAGHAFTCDLNEYSIDGRGWDISFQENSSNRGYSGKGKFNVWIIRRHLSTGPFSNYQYSNRPHLKHRKFHETYGYYAEGLSLGKTEEEFNQRIMAYSPERDGAPAIACPADWTLWHFDHIGVSRQGTEEDVHVSK